LFGWNILKYWEKLENQGWIHLISDFVYLHLQILLTFQTKRMKKLFYLLFAFAMTFSSSKAASPVLVY
jgi:uncharacterized membrane protein HdeD (DUF308 family)